MDPPRHKLVQTHEGVGGEGGGVFVIWRCGGIDGQVLEGHDLRTGLECLVGSFHELWEGNVRPRWGGGV